MPNTECVAIHASLDQVVTVLRRLDGVTVHKIQNGFVHFDRSRGDIPVLGYGEFDAETEAVELAIEDRAETGAALDLYHDFTLATPYAVECLDDADVTVASRPALATA